MSTALAIAGPPPLHEPGTRVVEGPRREGSELRWTIDKGDGRRFVVAMLAQELAGDESVRRRWVRDVERLASMRRASGLAPVLELGPDPDPRDPAAAAPWRVRPDYLPRGQTLEAWLEARAPAPIDEASALVAALADAAASVHRHGAVLRDLHPRRAVVLPPDADSAATMPRIVLVDVGLTRVDVLSTRTAASLLLEGSPYAAPEQLLRTAVDQRSDVYGLGVVLFRALTGELPHGEQPSLLRDDEDPAARHPRRLRPSIGHELDALVARCLDPEPRARPDGATELALALRGEGGGDAVPAASLPCQSCGALMRPGQRLCTACGKLAVQFSPAATDAGRTYQVVLTKIDERAATRAGLRERLGALAQSSLPPMNFLVGDQRMYSKAEQERLTRLPAVLVSDLDHATATAVLERVADIEGLDAAVREVGERASLSKRQKRGMGIGAGSVAAVTVGLLAVGAPVVVPLAIAGVGVATMGLVWRSLLKKRRTTAPGLVALRQAPAALPASDPLVARLAQVLGEGTPPDVRDHVGALALCVQRLVDHRAENLGEAIEIDAVTEPVGRLVELAIGHVRRIAEIDRELETLDEGSLVRAIAAAEARGEPADSRETLLAGLDRLRGLEEERAAAFHRLLEASALARRALTLGLAVHDERAAHERRLRQALLALGEAREPDDAPDGP